MQLRILILVFILSSFLAKAQTATGIKGGLNLSGLRIDQPIIVANDPKVGWQAGVFVKSLDVGWGFWAEAYINTQGSIQQFPGELQKNTVGYLSFPLGIHYSTANKWSFYLGGYLSFRLWASSKISIAGTPDIKSDTKSNVALIDYGPWVGISYTYNRWLFDLRYLYGIPNVNTNTTLNGRAHNYSGQLSIGYYLSRRNQR